MVTPRALTAVAITTTSAPTTPTLVAAVSHAIETTYVNYNNGYSHSGSSNNDTGITTLATTT